MRTSRRKVLWNMGLEPESLSPEAIGAFFAHTDRGEPLPHLSCPKAERDLMELESLHAGREVFERLWAEDFKGKPEMGYFPILWPQDFVGGPEGIRQRAMKVYRKVHGFVPKAFEEVLK